MRPGQHKRLPNHVIGLLLVVVLAVGSILAYTKQLPWTQGYQVKAVFTTAQNIRVNSPVRIAGVNVGVVTDVQHLTSEDPGFQAASGEGAPPPDGPPGQAASVVTMEITDEGRPIREDATFKLRPRLFLEGNLFVELHPGSPEAPEVPDGYEFPSSQTATSVQLDQVLTTLQSDVRGDLQVFLHEFGDALVKYGGAEGFQELYRTSPGAFKYTSRVNAALLGTEPHDLSGLVKNLDSTVVALDQNEAELQDLVTNLRIVTGSFAANDEDLQAAVALLPRVLDIGQPTLRNLDRSFPPLRAFAREALPGVRSTPAALDAATPLLKQVRGLVSKDELRGLVHDLRPAIPELTKLADRTIPFLHQSRAISSCFNQVIIPWSNDVVPDPEFPAPNGARVFEETGYSLTGLDGESRSGDANAEYIRVAAGGGVNTLVPPNLQTGFIAQSDPESSPVPFFGFVQNEILGGRPAITSSQKTPFRPDAPCEKQDPPDLDSGAAAPAPPQTPLSKVGGNSAPITQLGEAAKSYLLSMGKASNLAEDGSGKRSNTLIEKTAKAWREIVPKIVDQLGGGS